MSLPGGSFALHLFGGMVLVQSELVTLYLPPWLLALSYAGIGWAIGLGFTPAILTHAARLFPQVFGVILALLVTCGHAPGALVRFAGIVS